MAADQLKALHTALIDARKGYEEALRDSDAAAASRVFSDMIALREKHHSELHGSLTRLGEKPDEDGSFMATVHETVIGLRSVVAGLDTSALSSFVSGEERILDQYDDALAEAGADPALTAILTRQKQELQGRIQNMERLTSSAA